MRWQRCNKVTKRQDEAKDCSDNQTCLGQRNDHLPDRAEGRAPQIACGFNQVFVDVRHRDSLQYHHQRQSQRHVSDQRAKMCVQHRVGPKPDRAKQTVDHATFRQDDEPRKGADQIAGEEWNNQQEYRPTAGGFRGAKGQCKGGWEGDAHGAECRKRCDQNCVNVAVPEEPARQHAFPIVELESLCHAVVPHKEERHRDHEKNRPNEEDELPEYDR